MIIYLVREDDYIDGLYEVIQVFEHRFDAETFMARVMLKEIERKRVKKENVIYEYDEDGVYAMVSEKDGYSLSIDSWTVKPSNYKTHWF